MYAMINNSEDAETVLSTPQNEKLEMKDKMYESHDFFAEDQ